MANKLYEETHIQAIADAIREKDGSTDTMLVSEMAEKISAISSGGGDAGGLDALIDGSITEVTSNATQIVSYAFNSRENLTSANLPLVTTIGSYVFSGCANLTSANLPLVTTIGTYAFNGCTKLIEIDFPNLESVNGYAFNNCSKLISANLPLCFECGGAVFSKCINLKNVNIPLIPTLGSNFFDGCEKLETAVFPSVTEVGYYAFNKCYKLVNLDFPLLTNIFSSNNFYNCYSLKGLLLRSETICTLANTNAFNNCYHFLGKTHSTYNPSGNKDGYIYVPSALIEDYKVATNWSTFASQFRALEDYTVDGTITGELDETKI